MRVRNHDTQYLAAAACAVGGGLSSTATAAGAGRERGGGYTTDNTTHTTSLVCLSNLILQSFQMHRYSQRYSLKYKISNDEYLYSCAVSLQVSEVSSPCRYSQ